MLISMALPRPMTRGSKNVTPASGMSPILIKATENCRDAQVARERQANPCAVDGPVQGGDYGFLDPDHPLYEPAVRGAQVFSQVGVSIRALDDLRQVGAGGETAALAAQDDTADLFVFRGATEGTVEVIVHLAVEGVQLLRTVEGDVGHPAIFFVEQGLVHSRASLLSRGRL